MNYIIVIEMTMYIFFHICLYMGTMWLMIAQLCNSDGYHSMSLSLCGNFGLVSFDSPVLCVIFLLRVRV